MVVEEESNSTFEETNFGTRAKTNFRCLPRISLLAELVFAFINRISVYNER